MTPSALTNAGDFIDGTAIRIHLGEPHMIVVSDITPEIIEQVLRTLESDGELLRRTLPLKVSGGSDAPAS
jgi:hypothetical protein